MTGSDIFSDNGNVTNGDPTHTSRIHYHHDQVTSSFLLVSLLPFFVIRIFIHNGLVTCFCRIVRYLSAAKRTTTLLRLLRNQQQPLHPRLQSLRSWAGLCKHRPTPRAKRSSYPTPRPKQSLVATSLHLLLLLKPK